MTFDFFSVVDADTQNILECLNGERVEYMGVLETGFGGFEESLYVLVFDKNMNLNQEEFKEEFSKYLTESGFELKNMLNIDELVSRLF